MARKQKLSWVMQLKLDFISLGEVMIQLNPLTPGPLRHVRYFEVHVAGAEANTLIGLSRLGHLCGLITRVGNDEFGELILSTLRSEGIDVSRIRKDSEHPTGVYFIQRHYPVPGKSTVYYYRRGSAASCMSEDDVDEKYIANSRALYLTGITPALSRSCLKAFDKAYTTAARDGLDIVFDTNIRLKLWGSPERAKIVLTNIEDLSILLPNTPVVDAAKQILSKGAEVVVVKLGEEGAVAVTKDSVVKSEPYKVPLVEDVIGAGDAFNAAFIASYYRGLTLNEALEYANYAGALAVTVRGDIEALPTWKVLEVLKESRRRKLLLR